MKNYAEDPAEVEYGKLSEDRTFYILPNGDTMPNRFSNALNLNSGNDTAFTNQDIAPLSFSSNYISQTNADDQTGVFWVVKALLVMIRRQLSLIFRLLLHRPVLLTDLICFSLLILPAVLFAVIMASYIIRPRRDGLYAHMQSNGIPLPAAMTPFRGRRLHCPPVITLAVYYICIFRLPIPMEQIRLQLPSRMVRPSLS